MGKKVNKTLLLDGDVAIFKYASTHEYIADFGTFKARILEPEKAFVGLCNFIERIRAKCKCDKIHIYTTGSFNFRYGVLPSYKWNRQEVIKPSLIGVLKEMLKEDYECFEVRNVEADDLLGVYGSAYPDTTVVATIDKDLLQVPCNLYLWNHDRLDEITLEDADWWFYRQIITGDSTDGYTGVQGIGPKKAEAFLNETPKDEWWSGILELYRVAYGKSMAGQDNPKLKEKTRASHKQFVEWIKEAGGYEEYALRQARVARILRAEDYNFNTEEPILWQP